MYIEKIRYIFRILSCNNSEIARAAGCSRSYISHLLNEDRGLAATSKAVTRLVDGIYRFAEEEEMLEALFMLVGEEADAQRQATERSQAGEADAQRQATERSQADEADAQRKDTEETQREISPADLKAALTAWIFDEEKTELPSASLFPKRKKESVVSRHQREFGDRLDEVMQLLGLSNAYLARAINVDDSLVSRWRSGLRSCRGNDALSLALVQTLLRRMQSVGCADSLSKLTGISAELLTREQGAELMGIWLLGKETTSIVPAMDRLLEAISGLSYLPEHAVDLSGISLQIMKQDRYWNIEGLRQAVIRFLAGVMESGGELWLYSDETMEWLAGDASFFAGWKALMAGCIQAGVRIRIIHNVDRSMEEMLSAIGGWLPLYMSGQIEPYVCQKSYDPRFCHTVFLCPGRACIYGVGVSNSRERWYDYVTDAKRLSALQAEYEALLSVCEPLGRIYTGRETTALFSRYSIAGERNISSVLSGFSITTMPEEVLAGMLARSGLPDEVKEKTAAVVRRRREELSRCLKAGSNVCEIVALPSQDMLSRGEVALNLSMELIDEKLYYTAEDFAAHKAYALRLLEENEHFQLLALPQLPFPDIQIVLTDVSVTVIRSVEPFVAFSFTNPYIVHAFAAYINALKKRCKKMTARLEK